MLLGYNTNGFPFHRLEDAIEIIAECGYRCVALTLDVHHLDPFRSTAAEVAAVGACLRRHKLACVIETGSRYLLDPRRKHRPTLLDDDPARRLEFLGLAARIGHDLGASALSYWSGARPEGSHNDAELLERLARGVEKVETMAAAAGLKAALEPEPGMFLEKMADYDRLSATLGFQPGLTMDIGHLRCVESRPEHEYLLEYRRVLYNLQLDDMMPGRHQHLFFGQGQVDFARAFQALREIGYAGPACVELSDAGRNAVETAARAKAFLDRALSTQP